MGAIYLLGKILDENTELLKTLTVSYVLSLIINQGLLQYKTFMILSFRILTAFSAHLAKFDLLAVWPLEQEKAVALWSKHLIGLNAL